MKFHGVILYGPPASGKDAVTQELTRMDSTFSHFARLKVGGGRKTGYELITTADAAELQRRGVILYENVRYGNRYLVDRPRLTAVLQAGLIPVVHLGQVAGVRAVRSYPADWLSVLLWCPREVTKQRASARGSTDIEARLAAWDETFRDIEYNGTDDFDLRVDTDKHNPEETAQLLRSHLESHRGSE